LFRLPAGHTPTPFLYTSPYIILSTLLSTLTLIYVVVDRVVMEKTIPEAQVFSTSVKIEQTAKGAATISVHVHDNDDGKALERSVALYKQAIDSLKEKGLAVASEQAK